MLDIPEYGRCFTYVAAPSHTRSWLEPFDWYKAMVLRGCEYNRFPADSVAGIRTVNAVPDPDRDRRQEQWGIVARLS